MRMLSAIINLGVQAAHHFGTAAVASDVLSVGAGLAIPAFVLASQALVGASRGALSWQSRDRSLGRAASILAVGYGFGLVAAVLGVISYSTAGTIGGYTAGLAIGAVGQAVFTAAITIGAIAFLAADSSDRLGEPARVARRDGWLAIGAGAMGLGYLIAAVGGMIGAAGEAGAGIIGKAVAAGWIGAFGSLIAVGAATCISGGFYLSRTRMAAGPPAEVK